MKLNPHKYLEAKKIVLSDQIELTGSGNDRDFWDIAGTKIERSQTSGGESFLCTCKHCSIHGDKQTFCTTKIALIYYLVINDGKRSRIPS